MGQIHLKALLLLQCKMQKTASISVLQRRLCNYNCSRDTKRRGLKFVDRLNNKKKKKRNEKEIIQTIQLHYIEQDHFQETKCISRNTRRTIFN